MREVGMATGHIVKLKRHFVDSVTFPVFFWRVLLPYMIPQGKLYRSLCPKTPGQVYKSYLLGRQKYLQAAHKALPYPKPYIDTIIKPQLPKLNPKPQTLNPYRTLIRSLKRARIVPRNPSDPRSNRGLLVFVPILFPYRVPFCCYTMKEPNTLFLSLRTLY